MDGVVGATVVWWIGKWNSGHVTGVVSGAGHMRQ